MSPRSREAGVSHRSIHTVHLGSDTLTSPSLVTCALCPDSSGVGQHSEEKSGHVPPEPLLQLANGAPPPPAPDPVSAAWLCFMVLK